MRCSSDGINGSAPTLRSISPVPRGKICGWGLCTRAMQALRRRTTPTQWQVLCQGRRSSICLATRRHCPVRVPECFQTYQLNWRDVHRTCFLSQWLAGPSSTPKPMATAKRQESCWPTAYAWAGSLRDNGPGLTNCLQLDGISGGQFLRSADNVTGRACQTAEGVRLTKHSAPLSTDGQIQTDLASTASVLQQRASFADPPSLSVT